MSVPKHCLEYKWSSFVLDELGVPTLDASPGVLRDAESLGEFGEDTEGSVERCVGDGVARPLPAEKDARRESGIRGEEQGQPEPAGDGRREQDCCREEQAPAHAGAFLPRVQRRMNRADLGEAVARPHGASPPLAEAR